jgi:hypothetical protein
MKILLPPGYPPPTPVKSRLETFYEWLKVNRLPDWDSQKNDPLKRLPLVFPTVFRHPFNDPSLPPAWISSGQWCRSDELSVWFDFPDVAVYENLFIEPLDLTQAEQIRLIEIYLTGQPPSYLP